MNTINIPWDTISDAQLEQYTRSRHGLTKTLAKAVLDTRNELTRFASSHNQTPLEARHGRERARFRTVLSLLGVSREVADEASAKLADAMLAFPDGSLVFTHAGPMHAESMPAMTFDTLVAMWWQDDDYGSTFNELLWSLKSPSKG